MSRQEGFTLIEVLVALVVTSIAVVAVLQLVGGGLRSVGAAADHVGATLVASAKLSEIEPPPLEEGTMEGTEGAYQWVRRITLDPDLVPLDPTRPESVSIRAARVSVEVTWGRNHRFELATMRTWSVGP